MKGLVVDASVVLKWFMPDEEGSHEALDLLKAFASGELDLFAPGLLFYEVANGFVVAQRRGRVEERVVFSALDGFNKLGLGLEDVSHLCGDIYKLCSQYGCSAYDASYMALAMEKGVAMITADARLYNKIGKDLALVELLGCRE